ncbi:MAG: hypothetical protein KatS3mg056_1737 [Chloroflexus sp.]|nr:MAG: hypothetical protein KatS3mg056_1737 [Chloroflexus sp.]
MRDLYQISLNDMHCSGASPASRGTACRAPTTPVVPALLAPIHPSVCPLVHIPSSLCGVRLTPLSAIDIEGDADHQKDGQQGNDTETDNSLPMQKPPVGWNVMLEAVYRKTFASLLVYRDLTSLQSGE